MTYHILLKSKTTKQMIFMDIKQILKYLLFPYIYYQCLFFLVVKFWNYLSQILLRSILLYELPKSKDHSHRKLSSIVFSAEVIHEKRQLILHGPTSLANAWALSTIVSNIPLILSKRSSKTLSAHLNILLAIIINNNYKS